MLRRDAPYLHIEKRTLIALNYHFLVVVIDVHWSQSVHGILQLKKLDKSWSNQNEVLDFCLVVLGLQSTICYEWETIMNVASSNFIRSTWEQHLEKQSLGELQKILIQSLDQTIPVLSHENFCGLFSPRKVVNSFNCLSQLSRYSFICYRNNLNKWHLCCAW
jgi:hypothetical protein